MLKQRLTNQKFRLHCVGRRDLDEYVVASEFDLINKTLSVTYSECDNGKLVKMISARSSRDFKWFFGNGNGDVTTIAFKGAKLVEHQFGMTYDNGNPATHRVIFKYRRHVVGGITWFEKFCAILRQITRRLFMSLRDA